MQHWKQKEGKRRRVEPYAEPVSGRLDTARDLDGLREDARAGRECKSGRHSACVRLFSVFRASRERVVRAVSRLTRELPCVR